MARIYCGNYGVKEAINYLKMINKEKFISVMDEITKACDYEKKFNKFLRNYGAEGYIFQPNCISTSINLLHFIMGEKDKDEFISSFCFDYDFGRKYKDEFTDEYGNILPFRTPEDLYNLLMSND